MIAAPTDNILTTLLHRAEASPEKTAYIFLEDGRTETASLNYAELANRVQQLGSYLQTVTEPGDRLLLVYPTGLDFVVSFLSCLYAGAIAVPVYPPRPNRPLDRLSLIAEDTDTKLILTSSPLHAKLQTKIAASPQLDVVQWLATDHWENKGAIAEPISPKPEQIAFLQYTSGSTGKPKGVMVRHQNLLHNLRVIQAGFELTSESVSVTWLPHYHDMGLVDGLLEPLFSGCLGVMMPPATFLQQPIKWLEAISKYKGTHSGGPNVGYDLCVQKVTPEQVQALDLSSWASAYNGAEPINADSLKAFSEKFAPSGFKSHYFYPCYGMAESTLMISGGKISEPVTILDVDAAALEQNKIQLATDDAKSLVSCGQGWLETDLQIMNPDNLRPMVAGEVGEIWVSSGSIAQGYWQKQEATAAAFDVPHQGQKYFRTGDLGFIYAGELYVTGRLKDLLIIWGKNYYPQDLELTVAQAHPALAPAGGAAFSITESGSGSEKLVIVQEVERTARRNLPEEEVFTAIREAISGEFDVQVHAITLIKPVSIPKTSSGKIQRSACKQQFLQGELAAIATWQQPKAETTTPEALAPTENITAEVIETWLVNRLAQVLSLDPSEIEPEDSFSELGLDSSVMLEITGDLETWLHVEADPTLMWEYTDSAAVAAYLSEELGLD